MLRKRRPANSGAPGSDPDPGRSKRQRVADGTKILLDIAKESSDCFPFLKSALGFVNALIKHYEDCKDVKEKVGDLVPLLERFKQNIAVTKSDGDQAENQRRSEFSSALAEIEKRSRALLEKGAAARFVDKGEDSAEVTRLIERLREAITHYQISQQQAIYDRIAKLASSFDTLLKLHEKSPVVKDKLDSVMTRLDRLCSEDGSDTLCDETEHERRARLFGTFRLIRDNGNALYNCINARGYEECPGDILVASGMAEDIRDALFEYQTNQQREMYDRGCRLITAADLLVLNSCRRAPGAGYQHGERKGCLRGTRESVLNEIELWTKDFNKSPVFWLNGLAGTGKSTIAQTVSEWVFADGLLGASFFCSRDFRDRSDLHFIFPTLAFQLSHKYPTFRSILVTLLQSNPDVAHESLCSQIEKLIVEPLRSAGVSTVIVIDALDECKDDEPSSAILSVLGRFVGQIPMVKFFITGRPEPRIKTGFRLPLLVDSTDVFVLHDVRPALINEDIRLFLNHELSELARRRRLEGWPGDEHIDLLCHRAAGLFVYAVATVKFLDTRTQLPKQRLEVIVGLPECTDHEGKTRFNPNTTLDSLYTSILETAFGEEDPETYSRVRSTIGAVVLLSNPLPPSGIAELIGLDPEEVILFLTLVHSLLAIGEDFSQPVKPFHKSFPDFITDPFRCADARFYVSPGNGHYELTMNCLRVMNEGLEQNLLSLPDYALNSEVEDLKTRIDDRVGIALRYACQSWYGHLTKTVEDPTGVVSHLRVFLEETFLAWLEVLSVLGVIRVASFALEQVIPWLQQVAKNGELLDTARDCLYFVTRFFDPISVSATHIYHSALEMSPLSSIVRRLYYHRRPTPFPRVVTGTAELWDQSIRLSSSSAYGSCTWSPCGQFVAAVSGEGVEIRDALSSELVSTLAEPDVYPGQGLAYSPDGRSIACLSDTLIILDIQTGGAAKRIQHSPSSDDSIVWSLGGGTIGTILQDPANANDIYSVRVYDVALCTKWSPGTLYSGDRPRLWAHGGTFRVMAARPGDRGVVTIEIFEVGFGLTKIESFQIHVDQWKPWIKSFSPTTYRISVLVRGQLRILDVRNSEYLLVEEERFRSHCFSSDGSLFGASLRESVHTWRYNSGRYAPWREFPTQDMFSFGLSPLQFSPTSSSILRHFQGALQVYRLDSPPIPAYPNHYTPLAVLSPCGTYMTTARKWEGTVMITNLLSQTTPQFIDTGMEMRSFALTGNIILVLGTKVITAWRLTEEGLVDGVFGGKRAGHGDSIWTVSVPWHPEFTVNGQTTTIVKSENDVHVYHTGTGEVLKPAQTPAHSHSYRYDCQDMYLGRHYLHYRRLDGQGAPSKDSWPASQATLQEGWVKDPEGRHRLWVPIEWRKPDSLGWFPDITTLWLDFLNVKAVIAMF